MAVCGTFNAITFAFEYLEDFDPADPCPGGLLVLTADEYVQATSGFTPMNAEMAGAVMAGGTLLLVAAFGIRVLRRTIYGGL